MFDITKIDPADLRDLDTTTDGCSTPGLFKWAAKILLWCAGKNRNYACFCRDHDFDFRFGPKYRITFEDANLSLYDGVLASGHPDIAKIMFKAVSGYFGKKAWNAHRIRRGEVTI